MVEHGTAAIFQGQSEQHKGMGKELLDNHQEARDVFEAASEALDLNTVKLCLEDPENQLQFAGFAQPAIVTLSIAQYEVFKKEHGEPDQLAGHSLGEYSAAVAAKAIGLPEAVVLVRNRGVHMEEEGRKVPGSMAASLGLPLEKVEEICKTSGAEVANVNTEQQIIISGKKNLVAKAAQMIEAQKGKVRLLRIDVASHCKLMDPVRRKLQVLLEQIQVNDPTIPLVSNVTARYAESTVEMRANLANQVAQRVLWLDSVKLMVAQGARDFVEFGPGNVLSAMVKRIEPGVSAKNFNDLK